MEGKMMDAISRSELITFVKEKYHDIVAGGYPYNIVAWDLVRIIENFPALDVALVVHARWNEEDGTCSACCHEACYDEWTEPKWDYDWDENLVQTGEETHIQFIFSPYCPNCGARMDGEAE